MSKLPKKSRPDEVRRQLYDAAFCIVAARFNAEIVDELVNGACKTLMENGVIESAIEIMRVPGAFEIPLAAKRAAESGRFDGIIALGAVIRGGTPHFDYVCAESVRGLGQVSLDADIPIGNGILTLDDMQQAVDRTGGKEGHKGEEAALAAVEMVHLFREQGS
ncbi:MAG: 6,7-dimethyl-8-ribityllumazine synthase [Gammaproteobacteria bacterium]